MTGSNHFDVEGSLPTGTSVLEASAGTGKTYTIARLVSRYISEGHAQMDELLVVSFSEASSRELRDRVRTRLVTDRDNETGDARARLERALTDFDGATVTTTHGFCYAMLRELGTAVDHDTDALLLEDPSAIAADVASDLYLRKWGTPGADPATLTPHEFRELSNQVTRDVVTTLVPRPDDGGTDDARLRARIAVAVRQELARRLRTRRLLTYNDMVSRLDSALHDMETADVAVKRLRRRFSIVLVDEFQDTDPVQWRILRTAFHGHSTLVLVGDPKQAIYGFRGADVEAYLDARRTATTLATLPANYRSDPGVLDGLSALFAGAALGDPAITVPHIVSAVTGRMIDTGPPVRLRLVPRDGHSLTAAGEIRTEPARITIRDDVARQVVAVLGSPLYQRNGVERAVTPGDVAVIVRNNAEAERIRDRLRQSGVPAVVSGRSSIFAAEAADAWQHLLDALEQPHSTARVRRVAVSPFVGWTASTLLEQVDALALDLRQWLPVMTENGVGALFERIQADMELQARLLQQPDGERLLTDLRHMAEVLHEEQARGALGLAGLSSWLRRRRTDHDDGGTERSRRLESDAAAVQVLTSHMSKGLEFPVVLAPSLWDHRPRPETYPRFHEHGVRLRDVGGPSAPNNDAHVQANKEEDANEELRLAYVTLTRAAALVIAWWAPTQNAASGPLTRLLLHDDPTSVAPWSMQVPSDRDVLARAQNRANGSSLEVSVIAPRDASSPVRWVAPPGPAVDLQLASFDRAMDRGWRRTSFTALTQHRPGPSLNVARAFADNLDDALKDDEQDFSDTSLKSAPDQDPNAHLRDFASPWSVLPGGIGFGTLVHRVLERYEPGVDIASLIATISPGNGQSLALREALQHSLDTPLGPLADGRAWSAIEAKDQLRELTFELPLVGADAATDTSDTLARLVQLWRRHVAEGPLAGYVGSLEQLSADAPVGTLQGYLTGSIDAVLRTRVRHATDREERYVVVDYKTNRLAPREEPLSAWHYRQTALEQAMIDAHYPLQAVLYSVALHRYLRWRKRGYDPQKHLGGVLYLFLRGMTGAGALDHAGSAPGVFAWRPPAQLITGLSDVLAGDGK